MSHYNHYPEHDESTSATEWEPRRYKYVSRRFHWPSVAAWAFGVAMCMTFWYCFFDAVCRNGD